MFSKWFSSNLGDLEPAKGYLSSKLPLFVSPLMFTTIRSFYDFAYSFYKVVKTGCYFGSSGRGAGWFKPTFCIILVDYFLNCFRSSIYFFLSLTASVFLY